MAEGRPVPEIAISRPLHEVGGSPVVEGEVVQEATGQGGVMQHGDRPILVPAIVDETKLLTADVSSGQLAAIKKRLEQERQVRALQARATDIALLDAIEDRIINILQALTPEKLKDVDAKDLIRGLGELLSRREQLVAFDPERPNQQKGQRRVKLEFAFSAPDGSKAAGRVEAD